MVRLVRHMKKLQAQIARPETSDATEEEVRTIIGLLWEWTQTPNQKLPSKHVMENLVGLFRGCGDREYCYISRGGLASVIRRLADDRPFGGELSVILNDGWRDMTDNELYDDGRWNYRPTPLVELLANIHTNSQMFDRDGGRR